MRIRLLRPLAAILLLAGVGLSASAQSSAQKVHREDQHPLPTARPFASGQRLKPGPPAGQQAVPANGQAGNNGVFIDNKTANSQNLAKAEQEDEEYVFKHSASVRAFAKIFHLSPDAASGTFWALNALVLFVFVGYFLVTGLPKAFRSRRQMLERQMVEAQNATETANERMRVVEERLSRLDSEIAAVRAQAERDSAQDEVRMKQMLEEEKQKIVASAEHEVTAAGAAAERKLRTFAAELAVDRASARLQLSEGDDRSLIQEFAASLGGERGSERGANGSKGGRN